MNIQQALDIADRMYPNLMDKDLKLHFLTAIEQLIHQEIVMKHEHTEDQETLPVYTVDSDPGTDLIIPDPYSEVYYYWIMYKIAEQNLEFDKVNAFNTEFENKYDTMSDWYTRTHMPLQAVPHIMI